MKRNNQLLYGVIALLAIIILYLLLSPSPQSTNNTTDIDEVTADAEPSAMNFDGIWYKDWPLLERAQNSVQTLTSGQLIRGYIIEDPTNEDIVYFATELYDENEEGTKEDNEMTIGIYQYNTQNFHFERLFRRTYEYDASPNTTDTWRLPQFNVVGIDGNNLVLFVTDSEASLDACGSMLVLSETQQQQHLLTMNLNDPYAGFEDYTLPSQVHVDAFAQVEACQQ